MSLHSKDNTAFVEDFVAQSVYFCISNNILVTFGNTLLIIRLLIIGIVSVHYQFIRYTSLVLCLHVFELVRIEI